MISKYFGDLVMVYFSIGISRSMIDTFRLYRLFGFLSRGAREVAQGKESDKYQRVIELNKAWGKMLGDMSREGFSDSSRGAVIAAASVLFIIARGAFWPYWLMRMIFGGKK